MYYYFFNNALREKIIAEGNTLKKIRIICIYINIHENQNK